MQVGKLSVSLEEVGELGKVFVIQVSNNSGMFFDVATAGGKIQDGMLTLRVSKDTALLLSRLIEDELDTTPEVSDETH